MRFFEEFYKVKNSQCTILFYNIYFIQINLYQLKTLKMYNVSNPANAVVVGIITIIATVSLLIWKFNFYIGIDIYTSGEVLFKTLLYAATIGLFSYYFRYSIKISNTVILSLPLFFFCIRPVLNYKMTHSIGNVPLYATHHGQGLILLSFTVLACFLWGYTAHS
ncbi:hypothetical protein [Acinetobacter sp. 25977_4]|uniref:hypothetical protein n=1 Tax=Acinetobacter sp. 25977_4 TaxID=1310908 RepID=UPI0009D747F8|nr:hypothetical protein [Acinetobacter sp. 25977_4]